MKMSAPGRAVLKIREGEVLHTYYDTEGVLTGGVGHTGRMAPPKLVPGMKITKQMSDAWLAADLGPVEKALNAVLKVPVTQNQFDAMASLMFNVGIGYAKPSTRIIARLNAGDVAGAAAGFDLFRRPAVIIGRRNGEKTQFLTPDSIDREQIAVMQKALVHLGYSEVGAADGLIGTRTRRAVKAFQDDRHLPETGVLDVATCAAITQAARDLVKELAIDPDYPRPESLLA